MLTSVKILKPHRLFKGGEQFTFRAGVNLLVGEQGSGKSSLLALLMEPQHFKEVLAYKTTCASKTFSFDFEKHNPRKQGRVESMFQIQSIFHSHGETNKVILGTIINEENIKEFIFLMDEPDMALSIRSCYWLVNIFKKAANKGAQVIAAVHNPIIISAFEEVLSMEHGKWMKSSEFIAAHSLPE